MSSNQSCNLCRALGLLDNERCLFTLRELLQGQCQLSGKAITSKQDAFVAWGLLLSRAHRNNPFGHAEAPVQPQ